MKRTPSPLFSRSPLWLVIDGLALAGIVFFSVAAAVEPDTRLYEIGQIVSAVVLLGSLFAQRALARSRKK